MVQLQSANILNDLGLVQIKGKPLQKLYLNYLSLFAGISEEINKKMSTPCRMLI